MYPLTPIKVYAHQALRNNADAMTRMRRFLATMKVAETAVDWYAPEEAIRVSRELAAWTPDRDYANWKHCQPVVFTNFAIEGTLAEDPVYKSRPENVALFNLAHVLGYLPHFTLHHS